MRKNKTIKSVALILGTIVITASSIVGCGNKDMFDTVYTYDNVIMKLPDGSIIEGNVESWTDYKDGDQFQIKVNGKTYLVHSEDCVLIAE